MSDERHSTGRDVRWCDPSRALAGALAPATLTALAAHVASVSPLVFRVSRVSPEAMRRSARTLRRTWRCPARS